jgi:hypothetical protein
VAGLLGLVAALVTIATMRRAVPPAAPGPATQSADRDADAQTNSTPEPAEA